MSGVGIVNAYTSADIHPVEHFIFQSGICHITIPIVIEHIAVDDPVWILHCHAHFTIRPVLGHQLTAFVITFVHAIGGEVFTARKKVERNNRVKVLSLREHVLVFLNHVAET